MRGRIPSLPVRHVTAIHVRTNNEMHELTVEMRRRQARTTINFLHNP